MDIFNQGLIKLKDFQTTFLDKTQVNGLCQ